MSSRFYFTLDSRPFYYYFGVREISLVLTTVEFNNKLSHDLKIKNDFSITFSHKINLTKHTE